MKLLYSLLLMVGSLLPFLSHGQSLPSKAFLPRGEGEQAPRQNLRQATVREVGCGIDTLDYTFFKAADAGGVQVDVFSLSTNGYSRLGQWYDAPNPVTIHGLEFFAAAAGPVNVTVAVYNAGPDSLPQGNPLRSFTFPLVTDTSLVAYSVSFGDPVTVNGPYLLTIDNPNGQAAGLACSEWTAQEGLQEWLACAGAGAFWQRSYDVPRDSGVFDADLIMQPFVSYQYDFDFAANPNDCIAPGGEVQFNSEISPIYFSRFYNRLYNPLSAFFSPDTSFLWYFGDGDSSFLANPLHTYPTSPPPAAYTIDLLGQVVGYRGFCPIDTQTLSIATGERADLSVNTSGGLDPGQFSFTLSGEAETWYWNFGDNSPFVFNQSTPSHTYNQPGTYTVRVIGESCNTSDTATVEVEFIDTGIAPALAASLRVGPNPSQGRVTLEATRALSALRLSLLDAQGRVVWMHRLPSMAEQQRTYLDLSDLPPAMYWLRIEHRDGSAGLPLWLQ